MPGERPAHWNYAKEFIVPKDLLKQEGGEEKPQVRLMAGEKVNIRRSPKDGEVEGRIQEAIILEFNDQTGDALVGFEDESGKTATRTFSREKIEELNPEGSRKDMED